MLPTQPEPIGRTANEKQGEQLQFFISMERINQELFQSKELTKEEGSLIRGGNTGPGSKTLGAGTCDSVELSWGSDTSSGGTTTYHGSSTCADS